MEVHRVHPAPAILELKIGLDDINLFDFTALAPDVSAQSKRDLGPAREWAQWLNELAGSKPDRAVRFSLARSNSPRAISSTSAAGRWRNGPSSESRRC
jgi:hypothetical protein